MYNHALAGCIVKLRALDDDQVRGRVDAPGKRGRGNQHLCLATHKQTLRDLAIVVAQTGVMQADAKLQRVAKGGVLDRADDRVQLVLRAVDKLLRALVRSSVGDQVERGQAGLPVRRP